MNEAPVPNTARLARIDAAQYALAPELQDRLMSPALVIYMPKVQANVQRMLDYMGGDASRWRPHLKTTKTPAVYAALVDAGLRAFKCATLREARCLLEVLEARAITDADLLIAYPLQGPALPAAGQLAGAFPATRLSVLSEDPAHARRTPAALGVYVDVNPGMNRTGIPMHEHERVAAVAAAAGERFRGVHFYDGHIHDADEDARRRAAHAAYEGLLILLDALTEGGLTVAEVVTSGTPSFRYALDFPAFDGGRVRGGACLHRVSPGTVVFHDYEYDALLEDLALEPAALLFTRVISHPSADLITCDAGSKSIAAELGSPVAFALGHQELTARPPSEEHLPMQVAPGSPRPALGDPLLLVPRHVCPTVNLAEQALMVHGDGRTEVVEITARAHQLMAG